MTVLVELIAWWSVAIGVWLASLSAFSAHDLVVAVGCGAPCAVAAVAARRALRGSWRIPTEAIRWLLLVPLQVVLDSARVLALPLRRRTQGQLRRIDVAAPGGGARMTGWRAAAAAVLSVSPATFVVAVDDDQGTFLVHAMGDPGRLERAVQR